MPYLEANPNFTNPRLKTEMISDVKNSEIKYSITKQPNKFDFASYRNKMIQAPIIIEGRKPENTKIATVLENPIVELEDYLEKWKNYTKPSTKFEVQNQPKAIELPDNKKIGLVGQVITIEFENELPKATRDEFLKTFIPDFQKYLDDNNQFNGLTISTFLPSKNSDKKLIECEIVHKSLVSEPKLNADRIFELDKAAQFTALQTYLKNARNLKLKQPSQQEMDID